MNYTGIFDPGSTGIAGYIQEGLSSVDPFLYLLVFGSIIGYVYLAMQSLIGAVVMILLVLGIFGGTAVTEAFSSVPIFTQFLYIIALIGFMSLIVGVVLKRRGD